jgi:DNA-binding protein H-NS
MTKTYAQLTREIQALQASAEKLRAAEVKAVIAKLNESIAAYELTADDLHFPSASASGGRRAASAATSSSRSNASTDAKYSDGQGNTWGGRGPRPAWLRQAILSGKSLESFETSGGAASSKGTRSTKAASGNAKSPSGASKIKLPPLYGHPKTGQTWSGRGPKPAWLKQGLKKRGASIDDFLISAQTTPSDQAAAPAAAPAQPPSPGARAKPAASAAAKKSLGEKIASRSKSSADATPEATAKSAPAAPAKKAAASGKAAAKKTKAAPAAGKTDAMPASAPAKKVAAKPAVKQAGKPAAKKTVAPRKNLPSSMAPSADAAPTPSTVPAAAPMPVPPSDSVEGRGEAASA